MFTGIVESNSKLVSLVQIDNSVSRISVQRPKDFNDLKLGDSICMNGVCLTIVNFDSELIKFDLGPETLKITGWSEAKLVGRRVNLERSMKFGDRIHGHFLSGHVDELGTVISSESQGEAWLLKVKLSDQSKKYVWNKGSLGISGVSLTVNEFTDLVASVCLIPETLKLTNLALFKKGDEINIEYDWMAKAFYNQIKNIPFKELQS